MKLTSLTTESFRGFGRRQHFSLGDVNVLGGPNGFGKTSFFDSVLWCLFGSIPRLSGTRDFIRAGNVCQNKFSSSPLAVELTIETPEGMLLVRRTTSNVETRIGERTISERDFLERLQLADEDGISRFLRNFQLQQESINDFVRDLNPRGRYDSLVSLLEFQVPTRLLDRVATLNHLLGESYVQAQRNLAVAEERLSALRGEVQRLRVLSGSISQEAVEQRYEAIVRGIGEDYVRILDFRGQTGPAAPLRDRVLSHLARTSDVLGLLRGITIEIDRLRVIAKDRSQIGSQDQINSEIDKSSLEVSTIRKRLAIAENESAGAKSEVAIQRARVEAASKLEDQSRAALATVRRLVVSDICPVCQRPIDRQDLVEIIDREIGAQGTAIVDAMKKLTEQEVIKEKLERETQGFIAQLQHKEKAIEELRRGLKVQQEYDSIKQRLRSSTLGREWVRSSEDVEQFSNELKRIESGTTNIRADLVDLSRAIDNLAANSLVPSKEAAFRSAEAESERMRLIFSDCEKRMATLTKFKEAVSNSQVNLLTAILESHRPLIRSLYARMHPHPLFTDIDIEVDKAYGKGELYFKVSTRRNVDAYPSTIFSASQLNVLAVAVFLALNLRIESPLPITMLDDPIHSMDDLNVLGFCDVIRQLKAKRQLFVSTHSKDFYDLLLNKLRPSGPNEAVRGFWFASWSEEGPEVHEEVPAYVPSRIQISDVTASLGSSAA